MKTSPTQRSLKYLRAEGYICQIVEKWNPFAKIRQDLYGWIDIVCVGKDQILGVQTTSYPNGAARLKKASLATRRELKIAEEKLEALIKWHQAGGALILHEWKKCKGKWEVRVQALTAEDLE